MDMRLSNITRKMYENGLCDEEKVMQITENVFKCQTEKSSKYEDVQLHVDFWCIKNDKKYGVDVKGLRKNRRDDKEYDDTINWIELLNVQGNPGWVYGEASYIAFLTKDSVIYVPRKKLANFIQEKIQNKQIVYNNPNEFYQPYQRKGRLDMIVKIPTNDLKIIAKHIINYE